MADVKPFNLQMRLMQMVDLVFDAPRFGVVNFNILHALLHLLIRQLNLEGFDVEMEDMTNDDVIGQLSLKPTVLINEYDISEPDTRTHKPKRLPRKSDTLVVIKKTYDGGSPANSKMFMSLENMSKVSKLGTSSSALGMGSHDGVTDSGLGGAGEHGASATSGADGAGKSGEGADGTGSGGGADGAGGAGKDAKGGKGGKGGTSSCCKALANALMKLETDFKKVQKTVTTIACQNENGQKEQREQEIAASEHRGAIMKQEIKNELIRDFQERTKKEINKLISKIEPVVDCNELKLQLHEMRETDQKLKDNLKTSSVC